MKKKGSTTKYDMNLPIQIFKEEGFDEYIANCESLRICSQGSTVEEAKKMLVEAIEIFIEDCHQSGTLIDVLLECGFQMLPPDPKPMNINKNIISRKSFEKKLEKKGLKPVSAKELEKAQKQTGKLEESLVESFVGFSFPYPLSNPNPSAHNVN